MSYLLIPTELQPQPQLVLEPTLPEFRHWNGASLARGVLTWTWIKAALEDASKEAPPAFTNEELDGQLVRTARESYSTELSNPEREQFAAAALAATYPSEFCYRIGRRRKPTRYWGTILLGPWAHAILNRAADRPAPLPANVIPFPNLKRELE